ncbi:MAG: glycosyl hydrolase family 95 catalytic domain-containing protein [Planctomycetota bacterium]|jgi:hypothetical protein
MVETIDWEFPLPRTHTGILLGNARLGAMVWGGASQLKITLGRADLWDHRGGMPWTEKQNYADIRRNLEAGDEEGLRALFVTETEAKAGVPGRPSVIPVGRIELELGQGAELTRGELDLSTAVVTVEYVKGGESHFLRLQLAMDSDCLHVDLSGAAGIRVCDCPAWDTLGSALKDISFSEPHRLDGEGGLRGWVQDLPVDPGLAVLYRMEGDQLWLATARGEGVDAAQAAGREILGRMMDAGAEALTSSNSTWWKNYWKDVPQLSLPNRNLEILYRYGMYKFAGFSQPDGIAGTLQGPWIEEYQMPPWSSDYHFNINVQMCYWPAFKGNRLGHLKPLFDLIFSWEEKLRHNAKAFIGIDDGIMLPHAVDDRSTCMGGFWTGCIDHGCTAWVAQMMYDYAVYSGDWDFLREKAYPFMVGTMRVYEAMLEREGERFRLPVSVSPEYRGAAMNAWGADASFQLACVHRLIENLQSACERLEEVPDSIWNEIAEGLPKATLIDQNGVEMIALWEGTPLEESHRHHSHLAGICPFDVIDPFDPEWRETVAHSVNQWIGEGMGLWSGWCVPWASMLQSRFGNGDMAELLLTIWERVFTNQGRGTLHDCNFPGLTLLGAISIADGGQRQEIMQLDAGFGAVVAIQDMLMHTRRGVHHIFAGVPRTWKDARFVDMLTEGGFLVSATRAGGRTESIEVKAQREGCIRVVNPWEGDDRGPVITLSLTAGECVTLKG